VKSERRLTLVGRGSRKAACFTREICTDRLLSCVRPINPPSRGPALDHGSAALGVAKFIGSGCYRSLR
jgi:hypothetical protein